MEEKTKILEMLSAGKINVQEAEKLLSAVGANSAMTGNAEAKKSPKYLRVEVKSSKEDGPETVNVRVPFNLLRAGVKLAALMPANVQAKVNDAFGEKGINMDLSKVKSEDLEDLILQLQELSIDVDSDKEKVRVFVE